MNKYNNRGQNRVVLDLFISVSFEICEPVVNNQTNKRKKYL